MRAQGFSENENEKQSLKPSSVEMSPANLPFFLVSLCTLMYTRLANYSKCELQKRLYGILILNKILGMQLKRSTQWDVVGISAAVLTFVSFFVFMFGGPLHGVNLLLLSFGNPFLMVFYLLISLVSFIYGYVESEKKPELHSYEESEEIVFTHLSHW